MESLLDGESFEMIQDGLKETSAMTDRWVTIKRNSGFTGGSYDGTSPSPTYTQFQIPMTVEDVTQEEVVQSGGMVTLGDIKGTTLLDTQEKLENVPSQSGMPKEGDILIYEGREWYMVGVPFRDYVAGGAGYTRTYWKRR